MGPRPRLGPRATQRLLVQQPLVLRPAASELLRLAPLPSGLFQLASRRLPAALLQRLGGQRLLALPAAPAALPLPLGAHRRLASSCVATPRADSLPSSAPRNRP